jgi:hypothetical protein
MLRLRIRLDRLLRCYATTDTCNELKPFAFAFFYLHWPDVYASISLGLGFSLGLGLSLIVTQRRKVNIPTTYLG